MLLKYSTASPGKGKGKLIRINGTRVSANTLNSGISRLHRNRFVRIPGKRHPGKLIPRSVIQPPTSCDNSNDSGLGLDAANTERLLQQHRFSLNQSQAQQYQIVSQQQQQQQHQQHTPPQPTFQHTNIFRSNHQHDVRSILDTSNLYQLQQQQQQPQPQPQLTHPNHQLPHPEYHSARSKRQRLASVHYENEDACSNEDFVLMHQREGQSESGPGSPPEFLQSHSSHHSTNAMVATTSATFQRPSTSSSKLTSMSRRHHHLYGGQQSHTAQHPEGSVSKDGRVYLQILSQPEQQHRARYQTEGSRGAIKDRRGNGFPLVKLVGYNQPTMLQIYIGTDVGKVAPHMFYQACKVSSKNSTPCVETKVDGTVVIEVELKPEHDMTATCDCVGILKERNVDVEHRFPDHQSQKTKKKSTRCRLVFKCKIENDDGHTEMLQVCSQPIICTQPPGIPEISRKSLSGCPSTGGLDLFIIGKNFSKDTRVVFKSIRKTSFNTIWEESVVPEQEFLQQTHLICQVPQYLNPDINDPVTVHLMVVSNGKASDPQNFVYTPISFATTPTNLQATPLLTGPKSVSGSDGLTKAFR